MVLTSVGNHVEEAHGRRSPRPNARGDRGVVVGWGGDEEEDVSIDSDEDDDEDGSEDWQPVAGAERRAQFQPDFSIVDYPGSPSVRGMRASTESPAFQSKGNDSEAAHEDQAAPENDVRSPTAARDQGRSSAVSWRAPRSEGNVLRTGSSAGWGSGSGRSSAAALGGGEKRLDARGFRRVVNARISGISNFPVRNKSSTSDEDRMRHNVDVDATERKFVKGQAEEERNGSRSSGSVLPPKRAVDRASERSPIGSSDVGKRSAREEKNNKRELLQRLVQQKNKKDEEELKSDLSRKRKSSELEQDQGVERKSKSRDKGEISKENDGKRKVGESSKDRSVRLRRESGGQDSPVSPLSSKRDRRDNPHPLYKVGTQGSRTPSKRGLDIGRSCVQASQECDTVRRPVSGNDRQTQQIKDYGPHSSDSMETSRGRLPRNNSHSSAVELASEASERGNLSKVFKRRSLRTNPGKRRTDGERNVALSRSERPSDESDYDVRIRESALDADEAEKEEEIEGNDDPSNVREKKEKPKEKEKPLRREVLALFADPGLARDIDKGKENKTVRASTDGSEPSSRSVLQSRGIERGSSTFTGRPSRSSDKARMSFGRRDVRSKVRAATSKCNATNTTHAKKGGSSSVDHVRQTCTTTQSEDVSKAAAGGDDNGDRTSTDPTEKKKLAGSEQHDTGTGCERVPCGPGMQGGEKEMELNKSKSDDPSAEDSTGSKEQIVRKPGFHRSDDIWLPKNQLSQNLKVGGAQTWFPPKTLLRSPSPRVLSASKTDLSTPTDSAELPSSKHASRSAKPSPSSSSSSHVQSNAASTAPDPPVVHATQDTNEGNQDLEDGEIASEKDSEKGNADHVISSWEDLPRAYRDSWSGEWGSDQLVETGSELRRSKSPPLVEDQPADSHGAVSNMVSPADNMSTVSSPEAAGVGVSSSVAQPLTRQVQVGDRGTDDLGNVFVSETVFPSLAKDADQPVPPVNRALEKDTKNDDGEDLSGGQEQPIFVDLVHSPDDCTDRNPLNVERTAHRQSVAIDGPRTIQVNAARDSGDVLNSVLERHNVGTPPAGALKSPGMGSEGGHVPGTRGSLTGGDKSEWGDRGHNDFHNSYCCHCKLGGELLCCDGGGCRNTMHLECTDPKLLEVPSGNWYCPTCVNKRESYGVHATSKSVESIWDVRHRDKLSSSGTPTGSVQCVVERDAHVRDHISDSETRGIKSGKCRVSREAEYSCAVTGDEGFAKPAKTSFSTPGVVDGATSGKRTGKSRAPDGKANGGGSSAENMVSLGESLEKEYFVKWKGVCHARNTWVSESELVKLSPKGLAKFKKKLLEGQMTRWNPDWTEPQRLVHKRCAPRQFVCRTGQNSSGMNPVREWFIKWKGLGYEQCTWEPVHSDMISERQTKELEATYDRWHEDACKRHTPQRLEQVKRQREGAFEKLKSKPEWLQVEQLLPYQLDGLNQLRERWQYGQNTIILDEDDQEKSSTVMAFLLSLIEGYGVYRPILVVIPLFELESWEAEIMEYAPQLNTVVYAGSKDARCVIQSFELDRTKEPLAVQIVLTTYEAASADIDYLSTFNWEAVVIDESLQSKMVKSHRSIFQIEAAFWLFIINDISKYNADELQQILLRLNSRTADGLKQMTGLDDSSELQNLKDKLSIYTVKDIKPVAAGHELKEYWIGTQLKQLQVQIYCNILTKNYSLLQSGRMRNDPDSPSLHDLVLQLRLCCQHPYLADPSMQGVIKQDVLPNRNAIEAGVEASNKFLKLDILPTPEAIEAGIEASEKWQLIHALLSIVIARGQRVVIISQALMLLFFLDDYLRLNYGPDSYELVDTRYSTLRKHSAARRFNAKDSSRFVFLLRKGASGFSLKLKDTDIVIFHESELNPANDLIFLRKILHKDDGVLKIFRLFQRSTIEEGSMALLRQMSPDPKPPSLKVLHNLLKWNVRNIFRLSSSSGEVPGVAKTTQPVETFIEKAKRILQEEFESELPLTYQGDDLGGDEEVDSLKEFWGSFLKDRYAALQDLEQQPNAGKGLRQRKKVQYSEEALALAPYSAVEADESKRKKKRSQLNETTATMRGKPANLSQSSSSSPQRIDNIEGEETLQNVKAPASAKRNAHPTTLELVHESVVRADIPQQEQGTEKSHTFKNVDFKSDEAGPEPSGGVQSSSGQNPGMVSSSVPTPEEGRRLRIEQQQMVQKMEPELDQICRIVQLSEGIANYAKKLLAHVMHSYRMPSEPRDLMIKVEISLCLLAASRCGVELEHLSAVSRVYDKLGLPVGSEAFKTTYDRLKSMCKSFTLPPAEREAGLPVEISPRERWADKAVNSSFAERSSASETSSIAGASGGNLDLEMQTQMLPGQELIQSTISSTSSTDVGPLVQPSRGLSEISSLSEDEQRSLLKSQRDTLLTSWIAKQKAEMQDLNAHWNRERVSQERELEKHFTQPLSSSTSGAVTERKKRLDEWRGMAEQKEREKRVEITTKQRAIRDKLNTLYNDMLDQVTLGRPLDLLAKAKSLGLTVLNEPFETELPRSSHELQASSAQLPSRVSTLQSRDPVSVVPTVTVAQPQHQSRHPPDQGPPVSAVLSQSQAEPQLQQSSQSPFEAQTEIQLLTHPSSQPAAAQVVSQPSPPSLSQSSPQAPLPLLVQAQLRAESQGQQHFQAGLQVPPRGQDQPSTQLPSQIVEPTNSSVMMPSRDVHQRQSSIGMPEERLGQVTYSQSVEQRPQMSSHHQNFHTVESLLTSPHTQAFASTLTMVEDDTTRLLGSNPRTIEQQSGQASVSQSVQVSLPNTFDLQAARQLQVPPQAPGGSQVRLAQTGQVASGMEPRFSQNTQTVQTLAQRIPQTTHASPTLHTRGVEIIPTNAPSTTRVPATSMVTSRGAHAIEAQGSMQPPVRRHTPLQHPHWHQAYQTAGMQPRAQTQHAPSVGQGPVMSGGGNVAGIQNRANAPSQNLPILSHASLSQTADPLAQEEIRLKMEQEKVAELYKEEIKQIRAQYGIEAAELRNKYEAILQEKARVLDVRNTTLKENLVKVDRNRQLAEALKMRAQMDLPKARPGAAVQNTDAITATRQSGQVGSRPSSSSSTLPPRIHPGQQGNTGVGAGRTVRSRTMGPGVTYLADPFASSTPNVAGRGFSGAHVSPASGRPIPYGVDGQVQSGNTSRLGTWHSTPNSHSGMVWRSNAQSSSTPGFATRASIVSNSANTGSVQPSPRNAPPVPVVDSSHVQIPSSALTPNLFQGVVERNSRGMQQQPTLSSLAWAQQPRAHWTNQRDGASNSVILPSPSARGEDSVYYTGVTESHLTSRIPNSNTTSIPLVTEAVVVTDRSDTFAPQSPTVRNPVSDSTSHVLRSTDQSAPRVSLVVNALANMDHGAPHMVQRGVGNSTTNLDHPLSSVNLPRQLSGSPSGTPVGFHVGTPGGNTVGAVVGSPVGASIGNPGGNSVGSILGAIPAATQIGPPLDRRMDRGHSGDGDGEGNVGSLRAQNRSGGIQASTVGIEQGSTGIHVPVIYLSDDD